MEQFPLVMHQLQRDRQAASRRYQIKPTPENLAKLHDLNRKIYQLLEGEPPMSAQLSTVNPSANPAPIQVASAPAWTEAQVMAIKDLVAPKATPEEMQLFFYTATQRGLNPLLNQIYCIHRFDNKNGKDKMTIQTSIDGYRVIANRTGKLKGIERGIKYDKDGNMYAWAKVYRSDWDHPAYEEVALKEYKGNTPVWSSKPETMLKKVAESAALRMAFPEDLSGLYTKEEMEQTDHAPVPPLQSDSTEDDRKAFQAALSAVLTLVKDYDIKPEGFSAATGIDSIKSIKDVFLMEQAFNDLYKWIEANNVPKVTGTETAQG